MGGGEIDVIAPEQTSIQMTGQVSQMIYKLLYKFIRIQISRVQELLKNRLS